MDRSAKWRHPNPFRVTPPFTGGGTGHWEGNGKHWEQDGSGGYSLVSGDTYFELENTVDEGYTIPDPNHLVAESTYDEYEAGDEIVIGLYTWDIDSKFSSPTGLPEPLDIAYFFNLSRHVEVLYDYWNTWIYRNLNWTQTSSGIRRAHV
ncbi:MAG: hypothetical protein IPL26_30085 [Leptospiraceae bacterium]|nr:hypothetical protein [Leptospiraceae bacterium]